MTREDVFAKQTLFISSVQGTERSPGIIYDRKIETLGSLSAYLTLQIIDEGLHEAVKFDRLKHRRTVRI